MARSLYYDPMTGSDSNSGSEQAPKRTLGAVNTDIAADATTIIKLRRGRTFAGAVVTINGAGSIVIEPYGPETEPVPVIDGENARVCINMTGATGATIRGIKLVNGTGQDVVTASGAFANNVFRDVEMVGGRDAFSIAVSGAGTGNLLDRITAKSCARNFLHFNPSAGVVLTVQRSRIESIGLASTSVNEGCLAYVELNSNGQLLIDDVIALGVRSGLVARNIAGPAASKLTRSIIRVQDGGGGAGAGAGVVKNSLDTLAGPELHVENCLFVIQGALGHLALLSDLSGIIRVRNCGVSYVGTGAGGSFVSLATDPGAGAQPGLIDVRNSISIILAASANHTLNLGAMTGSNRNCYFALTGGSRFTAGAMDFATWKGTYGIDANSIEADPKVAALKPGYPAQAGAAPEDWLVPSTSPVVNAGGTELSTDFYGQARIASEPTIGPIQHRRGAPIFIAPMFADAEDLANAMSMATDRPRR